MMRREKLDVPDFYRGYVEEAGMDDLLKALRQNGKKLLRCLESVSGKKQGFAYAEGKWTVKEVLQHVIDAERVFSFRALWFLRNDPSPLPGFDEQHWIDATNLSSKSFKSLILEFEAVRQSTMALFAPLTEEELNRQGVANGHRMSVACLGYVCAGHAAHHLRILEERYLGKRAGDKKGKKPQKENNKKASKSSKK